MIVHEPHEIVTDDVFVQLPGFVEGSDVFVKLEGLNPAGSIKLKPAVAMVERCERRGELATGGRFVESSSGSLGVALAMVAAARGYHFTCVVDPNVSQQSLDVIRSLGAAVVRVQERDANGGFLATRIATVHHMLDRDPKLVWLNQYANPANPDAHASSTATAILRELGRVDRLFVGAGTTGTLMGCAKHFRAYSPWTQLVAVDSVGSVTFGGQAGPRHLPGLGASRRPELYSPDAAAEHMLVDEVEAVRVCRHMAGRYGLLLGASSGSILAAVLRTADRIPKGSRVVALSPDLGDRYVQTIYNDQWAVETYGPDALLPLLPVRSNLVA